MRQALELRPDNYATVIELGRLLARQEDRSAAEGLWRGVMEVSPLDPTAPYTLALHLIAWRKRDEATVVRDLYEERFGQNAFWNTLDRLIMNDEAGIAEVKSHLAQPRSLAAKTWAIDDDSVVAERALWAEDRQARDIFRTAEANRVGFLYSRERVNTRDMAANALRTLLDEDQEDFHALVVGALHEEGVREKLKNMTGDLLAVLAPQLAAVGSDTSVEVWERLAAMFPERTGFIDLVRLVRAGDDEGAWERLEAWLGRSDPAPESFETLLRGEVRGALENGRAEVMGSPKVRRLVSDAIHREVEVDEGVLMDWAAVA